MVEQPKAQKKFRFRFPWLKTSTSNPPHAPNEPKQATETTITIIPILSFPHQAPGSASSEPSPQPHDLSGNEFRPHYPSSTATKSEAVPKPRLPPQSDVEAQPVNQVASYLPSSPSESSFQHTSTSWRDPELQAQPKTTSHTLSASSDAFQQQEENQTDSHLPSQPNLSKFLSESPGYTAQDHPTSSQPLSQDPQIQEAKSENFAKLQNKAPTQELEGVMNKSLQTSDSVTLGTPASQPTNNINLIQDLQDPIESTPSPPHFQPLDLAWTKSHPFSLPETIPLSEAEINKQPQPASPEVSEPPSHLYANSQPQSAISRSPSPSQTSQLQPTVSQPFSQFTQISEPRSTPQNPPLPPGSATSESSQFLRPKMTDSQPSLTSGPSAQSQQGTQPQLQPPQTIQQQPEYIEASMPLSPSYTNTQSYPTTHSKRSSPSQSSQTMPTAPKPLTESIQAPQQPPEYIEASILPSYTNSQPRFITSSRPSSPSQSPKSQPKAPKHSAESTQAPQPPAKPQTSFALSLEQQTQSVLKSPSATILPTSELNSPMSQENKSQPTISKSQDTQPLIEISSESTFEPQNQSSIHSTFQMDQVARQASQVSDPVQTDTSAYSADPTESDTPQTPLPSTTHSNPPPQTSLQSPSSFKQLSHTLPPTYNSHHPSLSDLAPHLHPAFEANFRLPSPSLKYAQWQGPKLNPKTEIDDEKLKAKIIPTKEGVSRNQFDEETKQSPTAELHEELKSNKQIKGHLDITSPAEQNQLKNQKTRAETESTTFDGIRRKIAVMTCSSNNGNTDYESHTRISVSKRGLYSMYKEIRGDLSRFANILTMQHTNHQTDAPSSAMTLTGKNKGAFMHTFELKKHEDSHERYMLINDTSGEDSNPEQRENSGRVTCINSNTQTINNSILSESSCSERNPGTHLSFSCAKKNL